MGLFKNIRDCNIYLCLIDGVFSDWNFWNICLDSCGGGVKFRICYCDLLFLLNGGRNCIERDYEEMKCNDFFCFIDGGFFDWIEWL